MAHINVEEYYNNYNIFIINDEKGSEYNKIKTEPIIEINESENNYKEKIYENLKYILSKAQLIKSKILKILNNKIKILSKNNLINYYDKLNKIIKKTENFNCLMNTDEFFLELKSLVFKKQKEQNKFNVLKNALNRLLIIMIIHLKNLKIKKNIIFQIKSILYLKIHLIKKRI